MTNTKTVQTAVSLNCAASKLEFDAEQVAQILMRAKFTESLLQQPISIDVSSIVLFIDEHNVRRSCQQAMLSGFNTDAGFIEVKLEEEEYHSFPIPLHTLTATPVEQIQDFLSSVMECLEGEITTRFSDRGDTSEDCQRIGLLNAVREVEYLINGVVEDDIINRTSCDDQQLSFDYIVGYADEGPSCPLCSSKVDLPFGEFDELEPWLGACRHNGHTGLYALDID